RRGGGQLYALRACLHFGELDHFERASPVGQAADEAALLERRDQPVHARLGFELERFAHLVEARGNAVLFQALVDEQQQFALLGGEHGWSLPVGTNGERVGNKGPAVKSPRRSLSRRSV